MNKFAKLCFWRKKGGVAAAKPVAEAKNGPGLSPRLHFHFFLGLHGSAQDFEQARQAFQKYGPFHIYAPESANLTKDHYLMHAYGQNDGVQQSRKNPEMKKQVVEEIANRSNYPIFYAAQLEFIIGQPGLLIAPLEWHDWDVAGAIGKDADGKPAMRDILAANLRREDDTLGNMAQYWDMVKPFAAKFAPHLLELEEVRVFVQMGAGHYPMPVEAAFVYQHHPTISVSYAMAGAGPDET